MYTVGRVFDLLDQWRHLPDYQLERRTDIFFAIYLPAFLSRRYGVTVNPLLVPEFPVHIGTIYPHIPTNRSFKIDYLALADDLSRAWFVELKTDSSSRRPKQNAYLEASQRVGLPALIDGTVKIVAATRAKHKYCQLLRLLERLSLVTLPDELDDALASHHWASAVDACLPHIGNCCPTMQIDIVFLQPVASMSAEIGFDEFADWIAYQSDEASRFAESLRAWTATEAGRPVASKPGE